MELELENIILETGDEITYINKHGEKCTYTAGLKDFDIPSRIKDRVVSIRRPCMTTIYLKQETLTDKERNYLKGVIYPWREKVKCIEKKEMTRDTEYIFIEMLDGDIMYFPDFEAGAMYNGMEFDKEYTLKELGL